MLHSIGCKLKVYRVISGKIDYFKHLHILIKVSSSNSEFEFQPNGRTSLCSIARLVGSSEEVLPRALRLRGDHSKSGQINARRMSVAV